jgi:hypothetical protein
MAVLVRDQDAIHERHGEIGRHQRGGGGGERQQKARQQGAAIRPGKAPQAQKRPGGSRRVRGACARRARLLARHEFRLTGGTHGALLGLTAKNAVARAFECPQEGRCTGVFGQRVTPARQERAPFGKLQAANAGVIVLRQREVGVQLPHAARALRIIQRDEAARRQDDELPGEIQTRVEVALEPGAYALPAKTGGHGGFPAGRRIEGEKRRLARHLRPLSQIIHWGVRGRRGGLAARQGFFRAR